MFLFQSTGLQCFNKWESLFCLHNEQKVADHQFRFLCQLPNAEQLLILFCANNKEIY